MTASNVYQLLIVLLSLPLLFAQLMVGKSTRSNCHDLCHSAGYACEIEVLGSFSCSVAAQTYCKSPYIREQHRLDARTITCYSGGGCFVNCNENSYIELHRINATCGVNNCDIGEYSFQVMCPCRPKPTPFPEYEITMTESEEVGTYSLLTISIGCIFWLVCCSCSADVIRRTYYSTTESGSEEELETFMKHEVGFQTKALWLLWCDPCKSACWSCFQECKRSIYRLCCKPKQLNENSTHSQSSSHPLTTSSDSSSKVTLEKKSSSGDEESQSSENSDDSNPASPPRGSRYKNIFQSTTSQRLASQQQNSRQGSNPIQSTANYRQLPPTSSSSSSSSSSASSSTPMVMELTPTGPSSLSTLSSPSPPPPIDLKSHTNDSLRPSKSSFSELYGSQSSKLYGKPSNPSPSTSTSHL